MTYKHYISGFILLAAISFIIFGKSLYFEFIEWDDGFFIYENTTIMQFNAENLKSMFLDQYIGLYTPVLWVVLAIEFYFYQFETWGYKLTNIVFHIFNMWMVFYLFKYFVNTRKFSSILIYTVSITATMTWGIHPLRIESVIWMSQLRDVMSSFFCLLSLILYLQYSLKNASKESFLWSEQHKSNEWKYFASVIFFILALLSKPSVVPFPAVLILIDFYPLQRFKLDWSLIPKLIKSCFDKWAYFVPALCTASLTLFSHYYIKGIYPLSELSIGHRLSNAIYCLAMYMTKTLMPFTLQPYYKKQTLSLFDPLLIFTMILYCIIIFCLIKFVLRKKEYWPITSVGIYCVMLFPILGLFQAGSGGAGERFTYLATIPFFFCLGALLLKMKSKRWIWIAVTIWGVALSAKNINQQEIWRNTETFFTAAIKHEPKAPASIYNKLAAIKESKGLVQEAFNLYEDGLTSHGTIVQWGNSLNGMGNLYFKSNNIRKAEYYYNMALDSDPNAHLACNNLGNVYVKKGLDEKAIEFYSKSISIDPKFDGAYYNLGNLYFRQGKYDYAEELFNASKALGSNSQLIDQLLEEIRLKKAEVKLPDLTSTPPTDHREKQ